LKGDRLSGTTFGSVAAAGPPHVFERLRHNFTLGGRVEQEADTEKHEIALQWSNPRYGRQAEAARCSARRHRLGGAPVEARVYAGASPSACS
jgi:hypothetical protein